MIFRILVSIQSSCENNRQIKSGFKDILVFNIGRVYVIDWIMRFKAILWCSSMRHTRKCLGREISGLMSLILSIAPRPNSHCVLNISQISNQTISLEFPTVILNAENHLLISFYFSPHFPLRFVFEKNHRNIFRINHKKIITSTEF